MNSRERVLTALDHREPDRVPVSFGDPVYSSIFDYRPYGYRALCAYLGITDYAEPISFIDEGSTVSNVDGRLLVRFGADLRCLAPGSSREPEWLPDGGWRDEFGLVRRKHGAYWRSDDHEAPLRDAAEVSDILNYPCWPDATDPAIGRGKLEEARAIREAGYAVMASPGWAGVVFHTYAFLRGFEQWLVDMYDDPRFYHALSDRITSWDEEYLEAFLPAIADEIDLVMTAEDMGTQLAPFMHPDMYRKFCKPYHARVITAVRRAAPKTKIIFHSCGNIYPIIPDLIEIGIDVLNPIQPHATSMEPWRLKRDFGDALSFLGGVDIQELLPYGTREQVQDGVKELIDTMAPGGGFILAPSHQFQPDVPPENIVAMYDTALEHGRYPLPTGSADAAATARVARSTRAVDP